MNTGGNLQTSFAGGTILSIAGSIAPGDIVKTLVLATIGAFASLIVSHLLKWSGILFFKIVKRK